MGYRMILPGNRGVGRTTETFGLDLKGCTFNRKMQQAMGIRNDSRMGIYVSEDGFLSFMVLAPDDPNGFPLRRFGKCCTLHLHSTALVSRCEPGRYRIERRDGGFFVSECKWKEEAR